MQVADDAIDSLRSAHLAKISKVHLMLTFYGIEQDTDVFRIFARHRPNTCMSS
jgi:hypothetical protein